MEVIEPSEFLSSGMFREKDFRDAIKKFDWTKFQGKPVLIQGCASILPIWAYLVIMAELVPFAKSVSYGELKSPIPVLGKLGASV
jgi:hypothetical protein